MAATAAALAPVRVESDRAAINRANARHSTGPVTPEGKLASSRNATTHGIFASIDALPPHERAIFDRFLAQFQPPVHASEAMVDVMTRWAILRYRIDKCQRQESAVHAEMVLRYCEAQDIPVPDDPREIAALEARVFVDDLYGANAIMRLRNYELRLERQLDRVIGEYKSLLRTEAAASMASSAGNSDGLASFFQLPEPTLESAPEFAAATPRNAPCPCGSGLKFKRCCGKNAPPQLNL